MSEEADAEQVENFAFKEIRRRPNRDNGFKNGVVSRELHFKTHTFFFRMREQMVDDLKARILRMKIDAGEVGEEIKALLIAQEETRVTDERRIYVDGELVAVELGAFYRGRVPRIKGSQSRTGLQLLEVGN